MGPTIFLDVLSFTTMDYSSPENTAWDKLADRLFTALHLAAQPVAITFTTAKPSGIKPFAKPMSEKSADGRQGRVPAGCVFWMHGDKDTFVTEKQDHGNCSVGSFTHGLINLTSDTSYDDITTLLESKWVDEESVSNLPRVQGSPEYITYGPLGDTPDTLSPDVVLIRINGRQLMILSDALPDLQIVGKPQCHIIAIAKEQQVPAASVGCALSRVRTGMHPEEMTCAIPASRLATITAKVENAAEIATQVAKYAAQDSKKFAS